MRSQGYGSADSAEHIHFTAFALRPIDDSCFTGTTNQPCRNSSSVYLVVLIQHHIEQVHKHTVKSNCQLTLPVDNSCSQQQQTSGSLSNNTQCIFKCYFNTVQSGIIYTLQESVLFNTKLTVVQHCCSQEQQTSGILSKFNTKDHIHIVGGG